MTDEIGVGYRAIRESVAFRWVTDFRCLQLSGTRARDALEAVCPCDVFLRPGEVRPTVLLHEDGVVFADVYVGREEESYYLIGYGPEASEIAGWIRGHVSDIAGLSIMDLGESYDTISLDGPYSWELCAQLLGSDVFGVPQLGMMMMDRVLLFRIGPTGEYGYHLLVPSELKEIWFENDLLSQGAEYDLHCASDDEYARCLLENFTFDLRQEGRYELTPMELQLQWRLSSSKLEYPGAGAIQALRNSGWRRRVTMFSTIGALTAQEQITCGGNPIGKVLMSGYSPTRGDYIGKALLQPPYWHAGLDAFRVGGQRLTTISAPAVRTLSMAVNPFQHSYHTREHGGS